MILRQTQNDCVKHGRIRLASQPHKAILFDKSGREPTDLHLSIKSIMNHSENSAVPSDWKGDPIPEFGRLLGIDPGQRRIGLAVCTPERTISSPLFTHTRNTPAADAAMLRTVVEDYSIVGVIIGLPLHMGGEEGTQAHLAREFGKWVKREVPLPVAFWDERCSSAAADTLMFAAELGQTQRKSKRDMLAAQVILQSYIDAHTSKVEEPPSPIHDPLTED